jgi:hypothetical protein
MTNRLLNDHQLRQQRGLDEDQMLADLGQSIADREQALADREQAQVTHTRMRGSQAQTMSDPGDPAQQTRLRHAAVELDQTQARHDSRQVQLDHSQNGHETHQNLLDASQGLLDDDPVAEPDVAADVQRVKAALERTAAAARRATAAASRAAAFNKRHGQDPAALLPISPDRQSDHPS